MKKESLNDELKNVSPFLHEMKQQDDGFRLPEDYFSRLEHAVFEQLESEGARRQPTISGGLRTWLNPRVLSAAAAVVTIALAAFWFFKPAPQPAQVAAVELSEEEIEAWMVDNIHEFDAEQLASLSPELPEPEPSTEKPVNNSKAKDPLDDLRPEDVEDLLKDMSEEELELIL